MSKANSRFKLLKTTSFEELNSNKDLELPESDLCFQDNGKLYQFEFLKDEEESNKFKIEPGTWTLASKNGAIALEEHELKERNLLDTATNTVLIANEAEIFFSRLEFYEKRKRPKRRAILLYSDPGMGKTSSIEKVCLDLIAKDKGTVVIMWPTSKIEADDVYSFLSSRSEYTPECTRVVLIMEDIGGGEREGSYSRSGVDSGLLNLLDGVGVVFRLPTFIVATTNHPENLLKSLADRPGRFDEMFRLKPPSVDERIKLLEFLAERPLTEEETKAISNKDTDKFSIAHLEEIVVRSELHGKTYKKVIEEMIAHAKLFARDFAEQDSKIGIGNW